MAKSIDQQLVHDFLSYDPDTGVLTWKRKPSVGVSVGDKAGALLKTGYVTVKLRGEMYVAHRLAWTYLFGDPAELDIDHINRVRHDNRIANLRLATRYQNSQNAGLKKSNTSGVAGVCWHKTTKRWEANIRVNGASRTIGRFLRKEDAIAARLVTEKALYTHSPLNLGGE